MRPRALKKIIQSDAVKSNAIDKRGMAHGTLCVIRKDCCLRLPAETPDHTSGDARWTTDGSGEQAAQPIEQQSLRSLNRAGGQMIITKSSRKSRQLACCHGVFLHLTRNAVHIALSVGLALHTE